MGDHLKIYNYSVLIRKLDLNIDGIVLAHKGHGLFNTVHLKKNSNLNGAQWLCGDVKQWKVWVGNFPQESYQWQRSNEDWSSAGQRVVPVSFLFSLRLRAWLLILGAVDVWARYLAVLLASTHSFPTPECDNQKTSLDIVKCLLPIPPSCWDPLSQKPEVRLLHDFLLLV